MNIRTNYLCYLLVATILVLSSCKDDEEPSRRNMLIGTWEIQSGELVDYSAITPLGEINRDNIQTIAIIVPQAGDIVDAMEEGANILFPSGTTITFNDDNSFTLDDQTEVTPGTWALSNNEELITVQTPNDLGPNQLNFSIASLTDQQINIDLLIDENDVDLENFGVGELPVEIEEFTILYNFSFEKQ